MVFGLRSNLHSVQREMVVAPAPAEKVDTSAVLQKAWKSAFRGGLAGAAAQVINVFALMWMRTTINFQYRYGMTTFEALRHLYSQGGIGRFYRGLPWALIQAPAGKFFDTAANTGMMTLWDSMESTKDLPTAAKTMTASVTASLCRVFMMPVDACKTILQVEGADGLSKLRGKIKAGGIGVLWHGTIGAMTASFVGNYPWFFTYNMMSSYIPEVKREDSMIKYLGRSAIIGFSATAVSDTISNSVRVVKTTTQTSTVPIGYVEAAQSIIAKDGVTGLLFRGLGTKLVSNGFQGLFFTVLWKYGADILNKDSKDKK
jgi:hypothetical protein